MTTTLREEYIELVGKRPYGGWSDEMIKQKMAEYKQENGILEDYEVGNELPYVPDEKEIQIGHKTRFEELRSLKRQQVIKGLLDIQPIVIGENIFAIIDNDYIPWVEAEVTMLKKLKDEIDQIIQEKTAVITK